MKNQSPVALCFAIIIWLVSSCANPAPTPKDLAQESIIPKPLHIEATNSSFKLSEHTAVILLDDTEENISSLLSSHSKREYLEDLMLLKKMHKRFRGRLSLW